jgi:DNA-binding response OmpR family regulator
MINKPYRILIVDDEPNMLKQLTISLKNYNFEIETANDGEEGLKKLQTDNNIQAAIVDLRMPKMDGLTLIRHAKADNIQIPMIVLTGKGDSKDAFEASKIGVNEWFQKSALNAKEFAEHLLNLIETSIKTRPLIQALNIKNLTLFSEANLTFSPQLNVFIGENATGKTHLLKTIYSIISALAEREQKHHVLSATLDDLRVEIADKFFSVFRAEQLENLVKYNQNQCDVSLHFELSDYDIGLSFKSKSNFLEINTSPKEWINKKPVYLSTRELLSIYPNFVSIYENNYLEFEETWKDACVALGGLIQRNIDHASQKLLEILEKAIGGKIELDKNGRFYLNTPNKGRLEAPLISEGQRKLAMLAQLVMTGALQKGYLFWDEPEANLNPRLIKELAPILLELSLSGIQIFIATHSLFLLRELEICLSNQPYKEIKVRWFGLHLEDNDVIIEQGDHIDDAGDIASLKEELSQSNRFLKSGV